MSTAFLIEDQPGVKKTTTNHLKNHGFHVIGASNLIDAKKIFQRRASQINVVITDCRLVDSDDTNNDGQELAQFIKKRTPDLPVVGVSAYKQEDISVFDLYFEKAGPVGHSFFDNIDKVEELAALYKRRQQQYLPENLIEIKKKYNITDTDFRALVQHHHLTPTIERSLLAIHHSSSPMDETERKGVIKQNAELVIPTDPKVISFGLRSPFITVVSYYQDFILTELYGFPMIYTYGNSFDDSLLELVHLLRDYFDELYINRKSTNNDPDVIRFYHYLVEIFGVKEKEEEP